MDSISASGSEQGPIVYTAKQQKLLSECALALSKTGIEIEINPENTERFKQQTVALDVEHDEMGGFVGCGIYSGDGPVCYFSSLDALMRVPFHALAIIAHNGVSDVEILQMWGINVRDEQLYWDTMLLGHILDSSLKSYSLKDMAKRELAIIYPAYDDIVGKRGLKAERITLDKQPLELVSKYNSLDVICTWKLYEKQTKAMGI